MEEEEFDAKKAVRVRTVYDAAADGSRGWGKKPRKLASTE
jgi:hypothetical protein